MANTSVFRPVGPSYAVAVSTTASNALTVTPAGNDQINYCGFLNTSANPVALTIAAVNALNLLTAPAAVLPTAGSPTNTVILGVAMTSPMVIAVPPNGFSVSAITSTGTTTLYITPMADQS
jgi:hypothetical protein